VNREIWNRWTLGLVVPMAFVVLGWICSMLYAVDRLAAQAETNRRFFREEHERTRALLLATLPDAAARERVLRDFERELTRVPPAR
jgi:hypothetical protein